MRFLSGASRADSASLFTHRRKRTNFTQQQIDVLEKVYLDTKYPDIYLREKLEALTGLPESRIQVRFQSVMSPLKKSLFVFFRGAFFKKKKNILRKIRFEKI